jgi:hypothetical protein
VLSGTTTPTAGTGAIGDFYIKDPASTPTLYGPKVSTTWPTTGVTLKGAAGAAGASVLSGAGTPTAGTGAVGDFYIKDPTSAPTLFGPKLSTTWPTTGVTLQGTSGVSGYERIDATPAVAAGTATTPASTATCSSDSKVVVGGGYISSGLDPRDGDLVSGSYPISSPTPGWVAVAVGSAATIQAYAICMDATVS